MGLDMCFIKLKNNTISKYGCISHNDEVAQIEKMIANEEWIFDDEYTKSIILDSHEERLKDGVSLDFSQWDNRTDATIRSYVSHSNHYFKEGFYRAEREFDFLLYIVQRDMCTDIHFSGDPCCSREAFTEIVQTLNKWIDTRWDGSIEFIVKKEQGFSQDWIIEMEYLNDFVEYMNIADANGFTMWFSR